ncbi:MAG: M15 family metallopeptidase [Chlamydiota bacterium]
MELEMEFVELAKVSPRILMDIRYATDDNFMGKALYPVSKCYVRKKVAEKLHRIQEHLEKRELGLKVWDGYRPLSVQKLFWDLLPDNRYIANPATGSKHNRGAAVDVTLVDAYGKELIMPTLFDTFSEKAHRSCMDLPEEALKNRNLLEMMMAEEGFIGLPTEWWHFDDADWKSYPIEDLSLECLG